MSVKYWLVLKSDGKSVDAQIVGQTKDHGEYVIAHSKPIRKAKKLYLKGLLKPSCTVDTHGKQNTHCI